MRYSTSFFGNSSTGLKESMSAAIFEKLRTTARSGKVGLNELFSEADKSNTGKVSILEFRNVMLKLNIGLSSYEINQLTDFASINGQGAIDWKAFVKKLAFK